MTWTVPNRADWYQVEGRPGTSWNDRNEWCHENCQGRWIQMSASKISEFELHKDAVAFRLVWG